MTANFANYVLLLSLMASFVNCEYNLQENNNLLAMSGGLGPVQVPFYVNNQPIPDYTQTYVSPNNDQYRVPNPVYQGSNDNFHGGQYNYKPPEQINPNYVSSYDNIDNHKNDGFNYENYNRYYPDNMSNGITKVTPTTVTIWEKIVKIIYVLITGQDNKYPNPSPAKNSSLLKNIISGQWVESLIVDTYNFVGEVAQKVENVIPINNQLKDIIRNIFFFVRDIKLKTVHSISNIISDVFDKILGQINFVVPGTRWCGVRKNRDYFGGYGIFESTDKCCQQRYSCEIGIRPGEICYGLLNDGFFKRSSCNCDQQFYECLKNTRSPIAYEVGVTYFNTFRLQCYALAKPAFCSRYGYYFFAKEKCLEYGYNEIGPLIYQWFDPIDF